MLIRRMSFRMFLTASFILVYLVPVLMIGIPSASSIAYSMEEKMQHELSSALHEAAENVGNCLTSIQHYTNQVEGDPLIVGLENMRDSATLYTRYNVSEYHAMGSRIKAMLSVTSAFSDAILSFPRLNFALSTFGESPLWDALHREFQVSGMKRADWEDCFLSAEQNPVVIPNATVRTYGRMRHGMVYIDTGKAQITAESSFAVIYFLEDSLLHKFFAPIHRYEGVAFTLSDEMDRTLYSYGDKSLGGQICTTSVAGHTMTLSCQVPDSVLYAGVNRLWGMLLLIAVSVGIAGGLLVWLCSTMAYKPIRKLIRAIGSPSETERMGIYELNQLSESLQDLNIKEQELRENLCEYQDLLRYAAFSKLLKGKLETEAIGFAKMFALLDMPMPFKFFSVGMFYGAPIEESAHLIVRMNTMNSYQIVLEGRRLILFNHAEPQTVIAYIRPYTHILIAVGAAHADFREIAQAYEEAQLACHRRPMSSAGVILYDDVKDLPYQSFLYSMETETKLICLLREGRTEQLLAAYDALIHQNLHCHSTESSMQSLLDNIELSLMKNEQFPGERTSGDVETRIHALRERLRQKQTMGDPSAPYLRSHLADQILDYLDHHIQDRDLSLSGIADSLGVGTAKISRTMKEACGMGYLELVNRRRIELAKQYLLQDTVSIKQLAHNVGYDNDVTFRRLFKKYEGTTPSEYGHME